MKRPPLPDPETTSILDWAIFAAILRPLDPIPDPVWISFFAEAGEKGRRMMDRQQRILSLSKVVDVLVSQQIRKFPWGWASKEDLVSEAWLGAIEAVDQFDSNRGALLSTWASVIVRRRIQDYLRKIDPLTRLHRSQVKSGECEPVRFIPIDKARMRQGPSCIAGIEARLDARDLLANTELTEVERRCISGTWMSEVRPRRFAEVIGVTEAAVSQAIARAVRRMSATAGVQ